MNQTRRAFLTSATAALLVGCKSGGSGGLVSPSGMAGVVNGHMNSVYDCWVRAGIKGAKPNRKKIKIEFVAADGNYNGTPTFRYNDMQVGGLYYGSCGSNGTIKLAVFPGNRYNDAVLKHELCHHMDMQGPCIGGHPSVFKKNGCCPFWPYLSAMDMAVMGEPAMANGPMLSVTRAPLDDGDQLIDLNVVSAFRKFEDNTVADVLMFTENYDAAIALARTDDWWAGLLNFKE